MRVVIEGKVTSGRLIPYNSGEYLGSLIYDRLRQIDKETAQKLHTSPSPKPYSISNIE